MKTGYPSDRVLREPLRSSLQDEGGVNIIVRLRDDTSNCDYKITHNFTMRELTLSQSSQERVWVRFHEMVDELRDHIREQIKNQQLVYNRASLNLNSATGKYRKNAECSPPSEVVGVDDCDREE